MRNVVFALFALVGLALGLGSAWNQVRSATSVPRAVGTLRVGILPDLSGTGSQEKYRDILERFTARTRIPYAFVEVESYEDLLQMFADKSVDFAYFGGVTYVKARQAAHAIPLVMRDIDMAFTSYFLVPAGSEAKTLQDLKGKRLAFGARLSTSGHFMPRQFMAEEGIVPEDHFGAVLYSGAHDRTVQLVRDGGADLGVANAEVVDKLFAAGAITPQTVRILKVTPPYPDYVWALQPDIPEPLAAALRRSFLDLLPHVARDKAILDRAGAAFFVPASHQDFRRLERRMSAVEAADR